MKYRITISVFVDDEKTAQRIFNWLKENRGAFRSILRGQPNEERSFIRIERCYHDETPAKPCEVIAEYVSE